MLIRSTGKDRPGSEIEGRQTDEQGQGTRCENRKGQYWSRYRGIGRHRYRKEGKRVGRRDHQWARQGAVG